jgi:hypothetical protein
MAAQLMALSDGLVVGLFVLAVLVIIMVGMVGCAFAEALGTWGKRRP